MEELAMSAFLPMQRPTLSVESFEHVSNFHQTGLARAESAVSSPNEMI